MKQKKRWKCHQLAGPPTSCPWLTGSLFHIGISDILLYDEYTGEADYEYIEPSNWLSLVPQIPVPDTLSPPEPPEEIVESIMKANAEGEQF